MFYTYICMYVYSNQHEICNIVDTAIIAYGSDLILQYCIASSKYAAYKLIGTVRSNLLHNHSTPSNT